jgi:hypothetical protein
VQIRAANERRAVALHRLRGKRRIVRRRGLVGVIGVLGHRRIVPLRKARMLPMDVKLALYAHRRRENGETKPHPHGL